MYFFPSECTGKIFIGLFAEQPCVGTPAEQASHQIFTASGDALFPEDDHHDKQNAHDNIGQTVDLRNIDPEDRKTGAEVSQELRQECQDCRTRDSTGQ